MRMPRDVDNSEVLFPFALEEGDLIGVIAPSSPQRDDERLRAGIEYLRESGFRVREGAHLWERHGYLAGHDSDRLSDLNDMVRDPEVRMITAGRGGYGATRLLAEIDYEAASRNRPILLGFSDVTAINLAMLAKANLVTFSGAMPGVDLWQGEENDRFGVTEMWRALRGLQVPSTLPHPEDSDAPFCLRTGATIGRLIPVNLTLLASLCGTPFLPDLSGSILLLEEIGEEVYRIDRLMCQLMNAGILDSIGGLAFGRFTGTEPQRISIDPLGLDEILRHYADIAGVPTIAGVAYGHVPGKLTLPVGALCRLDAAPDSSTITLLQSGVVRRESHS